MAQITKPHALQVASAAVTATRSLIMRMYTIALAAAQAVIANTITIRTLSVAQVVAVPQVTALSVVIMRAMTAIVSLTTKV